jgi:hypothetical protein
MSMKTKLFVLVALSGVLFLLFGGSASAAVDFPADEAGMCAYVKAKTSVNLNTAKPAFATIERETSDYIIGTVAMNWHIEEQYPHVYVSTDGWVVAYYPLDRSSGWLMPWYNYHTGGPTATTTLKEAAQIVCDQIGGTTTSLKYYDFRLPDATKMMIIVEEETGGADGEYFKVTIPSDYTTYRVDWSVFGYDDVQVYLDGTMFCSTDTRRYGSFDPSTEFQNGIEHEINLVRVDQRGRVALVLEYAE